MTECRRTVQWMGKVWEITSNYHVFAYTGDIPCTGPRRCIYCGLYEEEENKDDAPQG